MGLFLLPSLLTHADKIGIITPLFKAHFSSMDVAKK